MKRSVTLWILLVLFLVGAAGGYLIETSAQFRGRVHDSRALLGERPETALASDWRKRGRCTLERIVDHVDHLCGLLVDLRALCSEV